jgi:osmoprotectant transport system ATP-binding protein
MHQNLGAGRLVYARMLTPVGEGVNRNDCESFYVTEPSIEFRHVEYRIAIRDPRPILSDVSLKIHQGETITLLGRSGSGKTTMLKLINRLRNHTSGDLLVEGLRVKDWNPIQLRRRIGYVIQEVGLFPHLTIQENVSLVPGLEDWLAEDIATRYVEVMQLVGLNAKEYANRFPRELSGGQRQRVGVARALAADPAILLMDEPFGALDPVTRAELQREFLALARKVSKAIVLVTHDVREALLLGTRVVLLDAGRIIAEASPREFLRLDQPVAREFIAASELVLGAAK